jgi:putative ABC transport system ATP-binding protein
VTGLSYRYRADGPAVLNEISLTVQEGEIVVLTGASGSGKTTLLSILGMLRRVPPGYVQLFGTDIGAASELEIAALRRRVRVIFQRHYLLRSLTVLQNVMIGIAADETSSPGWNTTRAVTFLENVGLAEHMQKWPDHLSGGQQQRVAVARALVSLPDFLLADEPTASLDTASARLVADQIREIVLTLGCGVVIATHDERIMHVATRCVHLAEGSLVPLEPQAPAADRETRT